MGWTWQPGQWAWPEADIQACAHEFWAAFRERSMLIAGPLAAHANLQFADRSCWWGSNGGMLTRRLNWAALQQGIADLACSGGNWVKSHDADGTLRAADYYVGAAAIELWTFADLIAAATGGQAHFRRATTWPTDWTDYDDPAYAYGFMDPAGEPPDIIGPWIFDDLQRCLNLLRWTTHSADWDADLAEDNYRTGTGTGAWAAAKAAAEADYAAASAGPYPASWPLAWTQLDGDESAGEATLSRRYNYALSNQVGSYLGRKCDLDWYVQGGQSDFGQTFDGHGDAIREGLLDLYQTDAGVSPAWPVEPVRASSPFGHVGAWTSPSWPAYVGGGVIWTRGYNAYALLIARWDVEDGFQYLLD